MNAIVVVDENWAIGKEGGLLVHLPLDLKYFKEKTIGKTVVIGRKTLESFPGAKPLPGRENIVLTCDEDYDAKQCQCFHNMDQILEHLGTLEKDQIFISGGETIYRQFMPYVDTVYVTKLRKSFPADRYFPNLDEDSDFELTWSSEVQKENNIEYQFTKYQRK